MKPIEFFKNLIAANSGYSSKRFLAVVTIFSGIFIPLLAMFIGTKGVIDDSILVLSLQLLAAGCGLLGFTLGEARVPKKKTDLNTPKPEESNKTDDQVTRKKRTPYGYRSNDNELNDNIG